MAEVERVINEVLAGDSHQEKQSQRISHYETLKAELMDTLKKIDEEEQKAANELAEAYARHGIASCDFDTVFEFRNRRKRAWDDYGTFLHKEKASLDKAKLTLMEQQEDAEKLEKMKTVEGYLTVALDEWLSVQPVQIPPDVPRTRSSITVHPDEETAEKPDKPKRLNVLGDIADRVKRNMFEWKQKSAEKAKGYSSGKAAHDYIETSRKKNNAIISLYHKVKEH